MDPHSHPDTYLERGLWLGQLELGHVKWDHVTLSQSCPEGISQNTFPEYMACGRSSMALPMLRHSSRGWLSLRAKAGIVRSHFSLFLLMRLQKLEEMSKSLSDIC